MSISEQIAARKRELGSELGLHRPSLTRQALEKLGVQVLPEDIGLTSEDISEYYPELGGDSNLGPGNDGGCQSWYGNRGWWRGFLEEHGV